MTDARRGQLVAVAKRFRCHPRTVYLLAGEVPDATDYTPRAGEVRVPRLGARKAAGYDIEPRGGLTLDLRGFDLGWVGA